jgi:hypothetical protein
MTFNTLVDPEMNQLLQMTDLFLMKIKQQTREVVP